MSLPHHGDHDYQCQTFCVSQCYCLYFKLMHIFQLWVLEKEAVQSSPNLWVVLSSFFTSGVRFQLRWRLDLHGMATRHCSDGTRVAHSLYDGKNHWMGIKRQRGTRSSEGQGEVGQRWIQSYRTKALPGPGPGPQVGMECVDLRSVGLPVWLLFKNTEENQSMRSVLERSVREVCSDPLPLGSWRHFLHFTESTAEVQRAKWHRDRAV